MISFQSAHGRSKVGAGDEYDAIPSADPGRALCGQDGRDAAALSWTARCKEAAATRLLDAPVTLLHVAILPVGN